MSQLSWFFYIILKLSLYHTVYSFFNVLLDKADVNETFGVDYEIYYVRNGFPNYHALNYIMSMNVNRNNLNFYWESTSNVDVEYNQEIEILNKDVVTSAVMNIPKYGVIPKIRKKNFVEVICNGLENKESLSYITIHLNFSFAVNKKINKTNISFTRLKYCEKSTSVDIQAFADSISSKRIRTNLMCIVVSFISLLTILILIYFVSSKSKINDDRIQIEHESRLRLPTVENIPASDPYTPDTLNPSNINQTMSKRKTKNIVYIDQNLDLQTIIHNLNIPRERVRLQKIEMEGTFGRIFNGTYCREDGTEEHVFIKTVHSFASDVQVSLFLKEGLYLYGLKKHSNILSVLAVSVAEPTNKPIEPFIIYSRQGYANLKKFLQNCKHPKEGLSKALTTQEIVEIAIQILSGIHHLHRNKILHKDLAARNCVINASLNVKITDSALSRDLFPNDYHCLGDNENRPVKWLSIESLVNRKFSTASDVWSYGVLMWELSTLAQQPYAEIDPFEVEMYLKDGFRLSQPINCPDQLFQVMAYCWAISPNERPKFSKLMSDLRQLHNELNRYV